jgi:2-dehydro-3-deoxyphosphogluconate aldolase/(4S)-4-hydroxy-2-oxoglutarate aldolase
MQRALEIQRKIATHSIVPVISIDDSNSALDLADVLIEGGLPVAEIEFRTTAATGVIRKIATTRPGIVLGAETILTPGDLRRARDAGGFLWRLAGLQPEGSSGIARHRRSVFARNHDAE